MEKWKLRKHHGPMHNSMNRPCNLRSEREGANLGLGEEDSGASSAAAYRLLSTQTASLERLWERVGVIIEE